MKKKSYADMDPLEEIRAIREEISREFKTLSAYGDYLRKKYPSANAPVESQTPKTAKKPSARRKASKHPAHV
jgi:hypothetical protein